MLDYKTAGVDIEAGYKSVELMKKHVKSTYDNNVIGDLGSFGGFYSIAGEKMEEPVLVAGTDGVGTKLKYAFLLEKHDTIGIDAVAMCVNSSAYVSEIFRSGIQSVDKGQTEAARSLGLSSRQTMMRIVMPQAIKNILPALGNEFIKHCSTLYLLDGNNAVALRAKFLDTLKGCGVVTPLHA